MFDHVGVYSGDPAASIGLYRVLLETLGHATTHDDEHLVEWDDFAWSPANDTHPPVRGLHIAFVAPSREHVDAFHAAGRTYGAPSDGAPGERPEYAPDYYGAFVLDPDGNSVEAVHFADDPRDASPHVDHLWIRVADHDASAAFYELYARHAGLRARTVVPGERTIFEGPRRSFSIVADGRPVTEHLHFALPASEDVVRDWHAAAVAAGSTDHGAPGPRPQYHEGYYGAFVLDPDGNNVELVDHHRGSAAAGSGNSVR